MTGTTLHHKQLAAAAIAAPAVTAEGTFDAIVSAWDVVDSQGDVVRRGAFERTIKEWRASGDPVPVLFAHQWSDVAAFVGRINPQDMEEVQRGLRVKGQLDIHESEVARRLHSLMVDGVIREFSFGFNPYPGGDQPAADGSGVMELTSLQLFEVSICLKGANPATELLGVKSALGVTDDEPLSLRPRLHSHPRPSHTSERQLRQRAEAAGLHLQWTERELRKASDEAHEEHVGVPTRALRRKSDEAALAQAMGHRTSTTPERVDTADTSRLRRRLKALLTDG